MDLSQYDGTVEDLVAARIAGKDSCQPVPKRKDGSAPARAVDPQVAGSDRAVLLHLGRTEIYPTVHTVLYAQRGRYLVAVDAQGRTEAEADAVARWFAEQALAKVPSGGTR